MYLLNYILQILHICFVGRPLWREDVSVFCICCWPLPAQSFSGPSPLGLKTIVYCLRFETSLLLSHGGGMEEPLIILRQGPHRKHVSRVRLRVHWSVTSTGRGAGVIENKALSIFACWTVFTEPCPGNALIKLVTIYRRYLDLLDCGLLR
jgi:hypothetical protein